MMRRLAGGLVVLVVLAGCARINLTARNIDKAVMMGQPVGRPYRVVRHFSEDTKAFYVLFDLATIHEPQIEKIINRELQAAGGDAVVNLQLKHQFKFLDLLLRFIAEPFFGSSTVTVEGDVAKFTP